MMKIPATARRSTAIGLYKNHQIAITTPSLNVSFIFAQYSRGTIM